MAFHGRSSTMVWLRSARSRAGSRRPPLGPALVAFAASLLWLAPGAAAQDRSGDAQQPPIQARPGGPESAPRTDRTIDVVKGARLVLSNNAGEVVVRSWERDQVRIVASHSDRVTVDATTADTTLRIRTRAQRGPASLVDFQLTVPRWMPVNLSGTYLEATIEGTTAEVTVETVHGNIRVVGGSGNVNLRTVEGVITAEKSTGKLQATTINESIRLTNISGDVSADTHNGDIVIENAESTSLEASTVNGDITFNGTMRDGGSYRLTTHSGDLRVGLGGAPNATVFVRTFQGDFEADFPIQLPEGQRAREGSKRFNFTLGSGSARVELQTFNGDISIARKSILSPDEERRLRRQAPKPPNPPKAPKPPGHFEFEYDDFDIEPEIDFDVEVELPSDFLDDVHDPWFEFEPVWPLDTTIDTWIVPLPHWAPAPPVGVWPPAL